MGSKSWADASSAPAVGGLRTWEVGTQACVPWSQLPARMIMDNQAGGVAGIQGDWAFPESIF